MYERRYGAKYHESQQGVYTPTATIAKWIRADIKAEIKAGRLPGKASNYSVRGENYSGGRAIRIVARDLDGLWTKETDPQGWRGEYDVLTDEGQRIKGILQGIHDAYNYNGSEIQVDYFDVNYYGHAEIETPWHALWRRQEAVGSKIKKLSKQGDQEGAEALVSEWLALREQREALAS